MTELARLEAVVSGQVQGVNFRVSARRQAERLGLTGWVRNEPDDTVKVVAEGPPKQLQQLLAWLHEGPPAARVYDVRAAWGEAAGDFTHFMVRY